MLGATFLLSYVADKLFHYAACTRWYCESDCAMLLCYVTHNSTELFVWFVQDGLTISVSFLYGIV